MFSERRIRLFVDKKLLSGEKVVLPEKESHYLKSVMRCTEGNTLKCFNNVDGEFCAQISDIDKKQTIIEIKNCLRLPAEEKDIWLLFAPLKKDKTDFVIEKAVELGISEIVPIITSRTNKGKIKIERYKAQVIEAAEQCERLSLPKVQEPVSLKKRLDDWDDSRVLFFMDERRQGEEALKVFKKYSKEKAAVLIGPEGGFDEEEVNILGRKSFVKNVSLGPRILRAETAAVAALSVWQAACGDWRKD